MEKELIEIQEEMTTRPFKLSRGTEGYLNASGARIRYIDALDNTERTKGQCMRKRWYKYHKYPEDPIADYIEDLNGRCRARMGSVVGDDIVEAFKRKGLLLGAEVPLVSNTAPKFSGYVDMITKDPKEGSPIGWELKSYWTYNTGSTCFGTSKSAPQTKVEYILQTALYAYFTKDIGIHDWRMLHFWPEKGKMRMDKLYLIDKEDIVLNNVKLDIKISHILESEEEWWTWADKSTPPPRDYEIKYSDERLKLMLDSDMLSNTDKENYFKGKLQKGDTECGYCPFKSVCWGKEK